MAKKIIIICVRCEARIASHRKDGLIDYADVARQGWGMGRFVDLEPGLFLPACPDHTEKPWPLD